MNLKGNLRGVRFILVFQSNQCYLSSSQGAESYDSGLWCRRQSQESNNSWETDLWTDLRFHTMKFFITSEPWKSPSRRSHRHLPPLSSFPPYGLLHHSRITGKVLKWIFDRTTLNHSNEVIFLQMPLLDWIYYQSFTSDVASALTSEP